MTLTRQRRVRKIETIWIPLADGCRLAASVWLPDDAEADPVPAILEYLPYRRRDGTAARDPATHGFFAAHGYAGVRVDMRGTGDSDGIFVDEYLKQEQDDALEVIAWLAAQPWCSGKVGMMGISWGGFNALQVAARRPPALGAIITVCSTDDRYADDTHYMGGCLLGGNINWASAMFAHTSLPPDPEVVGEDWRRAWLERLEEIPLLVDTWTRHQRRDDYWRHGSVCEDWDAIACPVWAVGGWADAYTNAIPRLLAGLTCPRLGLIGPWAHNYPNNGRPGPAVGFLTEAVRWWDHWLKGIDTGVMAGPMLRAWLQESMHPATAYETWPGRWVGERQWPAPAIAPCAFHLAPGALTAETPPAAPVVIRSALTTGTLSGAWCPYGYEGDLPPDQRADDGRSVVFDTPPLPERLEVLGAPELEAEVEADRPCAFLVARLCDVLPDGRSTRVSYGVLNLTHRDGHAEPKPLDPGRRVRIRLRLNDIGHAFPPGNRIRLALSNAYWPTVWPSPEPVTVTLHAGPSRLLLPVRPPRPEEDEALPPLPPPEPEPVPPATLIRPGDRRRFVEEDLAAGSIEVVARKLREGWRHHASGLEIAGGGIERYRIGADDPLSARVETAWTYTLGRGDWRIRTETRTVFTATADRFLITATLEAFEGEVRIATRAFERSIPRDLV